MSLLQALRRRLSDAEVSIVGAAEERAIAEAALSSGDPFAARTAARRVLDRAPRSPIGWALLADACELAGLDAELEEALGALVETTGGSPDVFLRLGQSRARLGAKAAEVREALVRAVPLDGDDATDLEAREASLRARLLLCDLDLAEGASASAEGWVASLTSPDVDRADVARRRLSCSISRRSIEDVAAITARFDPALTDAEGHRILGQARAMLGDVSGAARALCRAIILGDDSSVPALREVIAAGAQRSGSSVVALDEGAMRAVEAIVQALHLGGDPIWHAALAVARGDARQAATTLRSVEISPADRAVARRIAVTARDPSLLAKIADQIGTSSPADRGDHAILSATRAIASGDEASIVAALVAFFDALPHVIDGASSEAAWVEALVRELVDRLVPRNASTTAWDVVVARLVVHARALGDLDALRKIEMLSAERARPLRVAIVGEFNAGKSTFINALLGMDVAPTGILPTTAVAHSLRFGPDPIARARLKAGGARTVQPPQLKALLKELQASGQVVDEVEVEVPFAYLRRVEIVDTPGFNAPDPAHARAAMETLVEGAGVDVALWLFDAGQALKTSERRVLEAIAARGVAVQGLLNKSDRLSEEERARVLAGLVADLHSIGLASFRPPLAFSAREAVEARVAGDAARLSASGFSPVRALLEDELPAYTASLKDRGLRRRARDIATALRDRAQTDAQRSRIEREAIEARRQAMLAAARNIDRALRRSDRALRAIVERAVDDGIAALARERSALIGANDAALEPFLRRRVIEVLSKAIARAMSEALAAVSTSPPASTDSVAAPDGLADLWMDASSIARGIAVHGGGALLTQGRSPQVDPRVLSGIVDAALDVLSRRLEASAAMLDREAAGASISHARLREIGAFVEALGPASASSPSAANGESPVARGRAS